MNKEYFTRLKEIANTVISNEISLMTQDAKGWQDSINMRGKNLKISVIEEYSQSNCNIKISDEKGLNVSFPCEGVKAIEEYKSNDHLIIEIYFVVYEGFARMTVKGKEIIVNNIDKEIEYNKIITQAKNCLKCELMQDTEAIIGYQNGNLNAEIMFIAEAPGPKGADVTGIPLYGDVTGDNFEKLLASTGWTRSDIFITNAVLCCPTEKNGNMRNPNIQEVRNCHSYLSAIIDLVNPKLIVTLGLKALEALKEIENHQLILKQNVASFTKWNNRWIYPVYHPSPKVISTGKRTFAQQTSDFKQLDISYLDYINE